MKRLYAPWRTNYTTKVNTKKNKETTESECIFCTQLQAETDDLFFILKRTEHCAIILNTFPYNAGHLLIIPYKHTANLYELSLVESADLIKTASESTIIVAQALNAEGFNIGMNLGIAGGASIPSHLHMHVLPRWQGDTNFLPILGDTKQVSVDLHQTFDTLKKIFKS